MANEISIKVTGTNTSGAPIEAAEKQMKGFGSTIKDIGKIAAGVLTAELFAGAAERVKNFVHESIQAANDLGESTNAVGKIFDDQAGKVQEWAEKNANAFGLSKRAFNELATPLGALLKNNGLALDEVADHTIRLTERAADMASVFNTDVSEALQAIQAGLRGESDPLERYGVGLSAAAVEARALADTHKAAASQLTNHELILARLNILYDQTNDSAGDFKDTTNGLANSTRVANAQIEDAKAKIGEGLLPVMAKAAQITGNLGEAFGNMPAPLQTTAAALGAVAAGLFIIVPRIAAMKTAMSELNITMAATRSFIAGPWGLAIGGAVALVTAFAVGQHEATERVKELSDALDLQGDAFDDHNRSVIAARLEQEGLLKTARELGINTNDLVLAILGNKSAMDSLGLSVANVNKNTDEGTLKHSEFSKKILQMAADVEAAGASQDRKAEATKDSTKATEDDTAALKANVAALQKQAEKIADEFDPMAKLIHAQQDVTDKRKEYTKAVKDHGAKSAEAKAAELDLASAIIAAGSASADAAGKFDGHLTPAMREVLKAGKLTDKQIGDIEKQFIAARKEGDKYAKTYHATAELKVVVHDEGYASYRAGERNPSGHAYGGIVSSAASGGARGGTIRAHEQGEELFHLPDGSTVIPHGMSQQLMAGGGFGGGRLQIEAYMSRSTGLAWLDTLIEGIRFKVRTAGNGDPQTYLAG